LIINVSSRAATASGFLREGIGDKASVLAADLDRAPAPGPDRQRRSLASARTATDLARVIAQITDEKSGPLADVRRQVEQAAVNAATSPNLRRENADVRLEWIARRLHGLQQDLRSIIPASSAPHGTSSVSGSHHQLPSAASAPRPRGPVR
jgi:hypothetical protein